MAGGYRSFQRSEIAEGLSSYFAAPALDTRFLTFRNMMSRHEQWFASWLGSHPLLVSRSDLGARRSWADPLFMTTKAQENLFRHGGSNGG